MLDVPWIEKVEKCCMMPLLYWNKGGVSVLFAAVLLLLKDVLDDACFGTLLKLESLQF